MKNEDLYVYKKSDFYEDYIDSQKEYYERANADAYFAERLAEKDREIAKLKEKLMPCLNGDCILTCEVVEKYGKENAELKAKLENVNELVKESKELLKESQKMHQRCADNASKQIRRLKRALWIARAERAKTEHLSKIMYSTLFRDFIEKWVNVERKCRAKAEEYK